VRRPLPRRARGLAPAGAAAGMTDTTRTAAASRRSLPNGVWGIALFIATEATLFGSLIASYFYLRFTHAGSPFAVIEPPRPALPPAITGARVLAILPLRLASAA